MSNKTSFDYGIISKSGSTFSGGITGDTFYGSGAGLTNIPASGVTGLNLDRITSGVNSAVMTSSGMIVNTDVTATSFITSGGTSSQFVKGDGSLDTNVYSQSGHTHSQYLTEYIETNPGVYTSGQTDELLAGKSNTGHTHDVNGIADNSITNLKLAQVPTATIKGRASSGTGDVEDLTPAQALAVIGAKSATYQGEFKTAIVTMGTGAQSYQLPKSTISYFDAPMPTNATMLFKIDASNTANPAQVLTNELFQSVVYIQTGADITGVSFTYPNGQMIFGTFIMQSSTTYKFTWDAIRVNGTTVKIYLTITKV